MSESEAGLTRVIEHVVCPNADCVRVIKLQDVPEFTCDYCRTPVILLTKTYKTMWAKNLAELHTTKRKLAEERSGKVCIPQKYMK